MRIAVFGTGIVGRTLAGRLAGLGHETTIGTRDPADTLTRTQPDAMGNPPFAVWHREHADVPLQPYAEAVRGTEAVVNATNGDGSLAALRAAGDGAFTGKLLLDVANPLDFSVGFPPILSVCNTDSLAEQIQRAFPDARVVKAFNTMTGSVMVDPARVPGDHTVFLAGNDDAAKATVRDLLRAFGWKDDNVIDLGGVQAARGMEMMLPLWLSLLQLLGTPNFNVHVVRG